MIWTVLPQMKTLKLTKTNGLLSAKYVGLFLLTNYEIDVHYFD